MDRYYSCSFFNAFFLPEKESVGKKSRHKGGLRRDTLRSYSAQFPPLCIPPMTAQPIATLQDIVRNARQALRLAFLIVRMHVYRLGFSRLQSAYTRIFDYQSDAFFFLCGSFPARCLDFISCVIFPAAAVCTSVVLILLLVPPRFRTPVVPIISFVLLPLWSFCFFKYYPPLNSSGCTDPVCAAAKGSQF